LRNFKRRRDQQLVDVEVRGAEIVRQAIDDGCGVLITPNHATHADAYSMYDAADAVGRPFYFIATWHVFDSEGAIGQWLLQRHGVFSVDREGADLKAFKTAVEIVKERPNPLVIFPEGEVYHCNDRVTPFREGAGVIAVSAARRAKRPIVAIPCALKYEYTDDPTPSLLELMTELERRILWRPRVDKTLPERIYWLGEALLTLKELEYLGKASEGPLTERTDALATTILQRLEERYEISVGDSTIPERVKNLRRLSLQGLTDLPDDDPKAKRLNDDLDDLFLVVQLFSYPGDYIDDKPSIERIAETLDKFEEDVIGQYSATIRGHRRVTVRFGEAIPVDPKADRRKGASALIDALESRVQEMLDGHGG
jgi:1-acyl-sn-glycerol-3-phosphate acyltransferase